MSEEELLLHFYQTYPGVYLSVVHTCRKLRDRPVTHEWMFWHGPAAESVGPYETAAGLLAAVEQWEKSGERAAACELHALEESRQKRRELLARNRLDAERKATHDVGSTLTYQRAAEAERVADPSYTPTVEEACRNPEEFVEGMTEESFQMDPRD